jgi:hypothetical protein
MTATESTIREFLVSEVLYDRDEGPEGGSAPHARAARFASILKTVTFCEERFGITIPDNEVLPDHFESVRAIAALRTAGAAAPEGAVPLAPPPAREPSG